MSGPLTTLSEENYFSELTGEGAEVPKRSRAEIAALMKAHKPTGFDPIPFLDENVDDGARVSALAETRQSNVHVRSLS